MSGATIQLSAADYNDWPRAAERSQGKLAVRAIYAEERGEGTFWLSKWNFKRWRRGDLTPWKRPDQLYLQRGSVSWPATETTLRD